MSMTPQEIQEKHFHDTFRGYSHEEVDVFLDEVAVAFERLYRENQSFMRRVVDLEEQIKRIQEEAANRPQAAAQTAYDEDDSVTESTLKRMLLIAQETADRAVQEARQRAREIQEQARARADEMIAQAEKRLRELNSAKIEKERELDRAKDALRKFDQQYRTSFKVFIESQLEALRDLPSSPPVSVRETPGTSRAVTEAVGSSRGGTEAPGSSRQTIEPQQSEPPVERQGLPEMETAMFPVQDSPPGVPEAAAPAEELSEHQSFLEAAQASSAASSEVQQADNSPAQEQPPDGGAGPQAEPELVRPRGVAAAQPQKSAETEADATRAVDPAGSRGSGREGRDSKGPAAEKDADEDRLIRELFWGDED